MGALGIPHRKLKKRLGKIGIKIKIVGLQKTAIIYSPSKESPKNSKVVRSLVDTMSQEQNFHLLNVQHQYRNTIIIPITLIYYED